MAADPKVVSIEKLNARDLDLAALGGVRPQFIVCDVSFISLKLAMPPALDLAERRACAILLVKPQFEVGRAGVGKGGLVAPELAEETAKSLRDWIETMPGWRALGLVPSPIEGGDGNREWLLGAVKDR